MAENEAVIKVVAEKAAKPGYKSTEFWLSLMAMIISAVVASGTLQEGSIWSSVVGVVGVALTSMGYNASRATVKQAAIK